MNRVLVPLILGLLLASCSRSGDRSGTVDGPTGPTTSEVPVAEEVTASIDAPARSAVTANLVLNRRMTWIFADGCNDGLGLQIRLFDVTNRLVYPSLSRVFVIPSLTARQIPIRCAAGAKICFGARTLPDDGSGSWGVDLDGLSGCSACCARCGNVTIRIRLNNVGTQETPLQLLPHRTDQR